MYSRRVEGEVYTFGVSGKLIRNALVMYDRQTESLWSQILGKAVRGPLEGKELTFVPAVHTTWADWKRKHPQTLALVKGYRGGNSPYESYFQSSRAGVLGETYQDDRLYVKEFVIGVAVGEEATAYPFGVLNDEPLVNDQIGDTPVLVAFEPLSAAARVYERRAGGQTLTFRLVEEETAVDLETESTWRLGDGVAIEGPLAGERLAPVKSTKIFWFAWKDWYPHTEIYGRVSSGHEIRPAEQQPLPASGLLEYRR